MKILLGLQKDSNTESTVSIFKEAFSERFNDISFVLATNVSELIEMCDSTISICIFQWNINPMKPIEISDIRRLMDNNVEMLIVPIVDKSSDSVLLNELFKCNVYSAMFENDATIENIIALCKEPRDRVRSAEYYEIELDDRSAYDETNEATTVGEVKTIQAEPVKKNRVNRIRPSSESDKILVEVKSEEVQKSPIPSDYKKTLLVLSFEPKAGATTIAAELAEMSSKMGIHTSVIDMDPIKLDLFYHFPLKKGETGLGTFIGADSPSVPKGKQINNELSVVTDSFREIPKVSSEKLLRSYMAILNKARKENQFIVIDMPYRSKQHELFSSILEWVDNVLLVVNQDAGMIERTELFAPLLSNVTFDFVINRYDSDVRVYKEQRIGNLLTKMGMKFNRSFVVPYSKFAAQSLSNKERICQRNDEREFNANIESILDYYYGGNKKVPLFKKLFGL